MKLLDPITRPSGKEEVTQRPAWRVQAPDETVHWAYIEIRNGRPTITGYAEFYVVQTAAPPNRLAGALAGGSMGVLLGAASGDLIGAIILGVVGAIFGAVGA